MLWLITTLNFALGAHRLVRDAFSTVHGEPLGEGAVTSVKVLVPFEADVGPGLLTGTQAALVSLQILIADAIMVCSPLPMFRVTINCLFSRYGDFGLSTGDPASMSSSRGSSGSDVWEWSYGCCACS
jgi:hypothetical protein